MLEDAKQQLIKDGHISETVGMTGMTGMTGMYSDAKQIDAFHSRANDVVWQETR